MRYEILGPLQIVDGEAVTFVASRKIQTLLAVLLVRSGQVLTPEQLVDEIWGDQPPGNPQACLHVYVSQLRKLLERHGRAEDLAATCPPGYRLAVEPDELDLHLYRRAIDEGRAELRADRLAAACERFDSALALFPGPSVAERLSQGPILSGFAAWLVESRLECLELQICVRLRLGHHRESVGVLYSLIKEHPLREPFYHHLMLALYRSGRTSDALRVFQSVRSQLREELGLEPGRALRALHQAILRADARLEIAPSLQPLYAAA